MYAGNRPDDAARAVHRRFVTGWQPRLLPFAGVLAVRGRVSGDVVRVPVVVARYRGRPYLVSMLGEEVNWVRNVRAAGGEAQLLSGRLALRPRGRRARVRLVEVPVAARVPVLRRYLALAWGAHPHLPVRAWSSSAAIRAVAARYPVFRVDAAPRP